MHSFDDPRRQPLSLHEVCMEHIRRVLAFCNGNRSKAARVLGIGRTSLYRYLEEEQNVNDSCPGSSGVEPSPGPPSVLGQAATTELGKVSACDHSLEAVWVPGPAFLPLGPQPMLLLLPVPPTAAEPGRKSPTRGK